MINIREDAIAKLRMLLLSLSLCMYQLPYKGSDTSVIVFRRSHSVSAEWGTRPKGPSKRALRRVVENGRAARDVEPRDVVPATCDRMCCCQRERVDVLIRYVCRRRVQKQACRAHAFHVRYFPLRLREHTHHADRRRSNESKWMRTIRELVSRPLSGFRPTLDIQQLV